MVLISSKFISDLKVCADLYIKLKEFNSLTWTKKTVKKTNQNKG